MSTKFQPIIAATLTRVPDRDGYLVAPPIAWPTLASVIQDDGAGRVTAGTYHKSHGTIRGTATRKPQDTYISGGTHIALGQSGRSFVIDAGTAYDNWKPADYSGNYGIQWKDASSGVSFGCHASAQDASGIEDHEVIIRQGVPAVGSSPSASQYYFKYEIAYGSKYSWRLVGEWQNPLRLEATTDTGATWETVAVSKWMRSYREWHQAHGGQIAFRVMVDDEHDRIYFQFDGSGGWTLEAHRDHNLASKGCPKLTGVNSWCTFQYYPLRYQPIQVTTPKKVMPTGITNGGATLKTNSLAKTDGNQTVSSMVNHDPTTGLSANLTVSRADAGDGLGSSKPPKLSDATVIIPAVWSEGLGSGSANLRVESVLERETFNMTTRQWTRSATVTCQNTYGELSGLSGNFAIDLYASNGGPYELRFSSIATNPRYMRHDPDRKVEFSVVDPSIVLDEPIGQEIIVDGWALCSAARFILEACNVHPKYMSRIPEYRYGPADADCPFYILPRGTGLNAKFRFDPAMTGRACLNLLCQDSSDIDPFTGLPSPYMMGFSHNHQYNFAPPILRANIPVMAYYDTDPTGEGQIEDIMVYSDVSDLRTDLDFQGLDAFTNELLYVHQDQPDWVKNLKGWRSPWIERSARMASEPYINYVIQGAAIQASLVPVWATIKVPFWPHVHAGDNVVIGEDRHLGGIYTFVVEEGMHKYGQMGAFGECYSILTCRALDTIV